MYGAIGRILLLVESEVAIVEGRIGQAVAEGIEGLVPGIEVIRRAPEEGVAGIVGYVGDAQLGPGGRAAVLAWL